MEKPSNNLTFLRKLRDSYKGFLQVLITEFIMTKEDHGVRLDLNFGNQDQCINDPGLKQELNLVVNQDPNNKNKFLKEYTEFAKNDKNRSYKFNHPGFPLRHANGGVLPIVRYKNQEYFCLFLRTIFPMGWNIANGGSNNKEELYRPEYVIFREFSEELIIKDDRKKILYIIDSDNEKVMCGTQDDLIELLNDDAHINYDKYVRLSTPLKWFDGPDKIVIRDDHDKYSSEGYFINITPDDNAIELDKIAYIKLDDEASLLDGEVVRTIDTNKPKRLNRIIGLFETKKFMKNINQQDFKPDLIFFNGKKRVPEQLENIIKKYLQSVQNIREEGGRKEFQAQADKFNLCPITRKIIERYIEWLKIANNNLEKKKEINDKLSGNVLKKYQVFISFKSQDEEIAGSLYDFLTKNGLQVFASNRSLEQMGESAYAQVIDKALDTSMFLVVVSSNPEYFYSGWMSYEWRSFINEIHSGRKNDGNVYTLTTGISITEMPFSLRQFQNFIYQKTDPYTSFQSVFNFIGNARRKK